MSSTPQSASIERRMSGFLQLVPTTSTSYPQIQRSQQPKTTLTEEATTVPAALTADALAAAAAAAPAAAPAPAAVADQEPLKRRSSSMSSYGAKNADVFRFLKLGPVHWGEHMEDHQGDFAVE